jgi:ornithine cyclodeaminase/alanine dehydrogenase-like protein (mu-crystallin family)
MNSKTPVVWLTESDVTDLVTLNDAIDALEVQLRQLATKRAFNVPKALASYGEGASMHSLGSCSREAGYAGFKNWVFTRSGASALFALFDANDGSLVAVIEAAALGQLRTSAISGLATRWLAAPNADTLALIGTGSQALTQAVAVALVRNLRRIQVYGRSPEKRAAFVQRLAAAVPCEVVESASVEAATEGADIVTLVTRAQEPFLSSRMLSLGAHLNAVGAILPSNAEFEQDVFDRASLLVVDDMDGVQKNSREFITQFGGGGDWSVVETLGHRISLGRRRPVIAALTVFKAMGMGISDLAIAVLALERSRERGAGSHIAKAQRSTLRWELPEHV